MDKLVGQSYTGVAKNGDIIYGFRFETTGEYAKLRYILNQMLSSPPLATELALHVLIHKLKEDFFKDSGQFEKCCGELCLKRPKHDQK